MTLRFELDEPAHVIIRAHDTLGREVARLADAAFAAGSHRATWRLGGLASGVYLLNLHAAGGQQTRRVVVVR